MRVLSVDIGGTNMKFGIIDDASPGIGSWQRVRTPRPADPASVIAAIVGFAAGKGVQRASIGFPGVVDRGVVKTAPNLDTRLWAGFDLLGELRSELAIPIRVLNDAAVNGLGAVHGPGLECVLTLGTGLGCALLRDRQLLLALELGQFRCADQSFDDLVGQRGLDAVGLNVWRSRVDDVIVRVFALTACERIYIGGGNSRHVAGALPADVELVDSSRGVVGAPRMWEPACDWFFQGVPGAFG